MSVLPPPIHETLQQALGEPVKRATSVGGGCINAAYRVTLAGGSDVFVKMHANASAMPGLFAAEAAGLEALASAETSVAVPRVLAVGQDFLATEWLDFSGGRGLEETLGRGLAALHHATAQSMFGFACDNYLGATPQANTQHASWAVFWRERRLGPMLACMRGDGELQRLGGRLMERLDVILDVGEEPACLLHGDLWSGNALLLADGRAAIFDPACYYGCREAEFGMIRLFGFAARFEAAYHEVYPLPEGADRRIPIYMLHHLLNHLHLFGASYRDACVRTLRDVLQY